MISQIFAYPFRIFFLSVALLALLVVPAWLLVLPGGVALPLAFAPLHWHQHEMLFGFLQAAIAGFLLTAVCNWTGTDRLHGVPLMALWALWLAGRVLMWGGAAAPAWLVHVVDLAFLPAVMADAGWRIVKSRQWRQAVVMAVLGVLWLMEIGFHARPGPPFAGGALLMAMTLMLVIGGRITPAFSGNWLRMHGGDPSRIVVIPWLERLTLGAMAATLGLYLVEAPAVLGILTALLAAGASAARLILWRGWLVRGEPLLWILHLALAWIPVSLLLLAASVAGWVAPTAWLHAGGVGAMGALFLGVMSRVALGHTGRPLRLPPGMTAAFSFMLAAGIVRVATALGAMPWRIGVDLAATLWVLAYLLFLIRYAGILSGPRADGKAG